MQPSQRAPKDNASAERRPPQEDEPEGFAWKGALAVLVVVAGLVVWRALSPAEDDAGGSAVPQGGDGDARVLDDGADPSASATAAPEPPRCTPAGPPPFVIGDAPRAPRGDGGGDDGAQDLAPFAVEVGRGTTFSGGFAVGAQREAEGGTVAMVATLSADGAQGKLVRLARSRGDMDPPVVAGAGDAIVAAMLEPNAGGRAIRVARVDGEHVTWGAELAEGRDESLALDVAVSGDRAVLVWDDITQDGKRSRVMLSSVDVATLRSVASPRPVSQPSTDAELPRAIARPGGYWLAYVARAEEPARGGSANKKEAALESEDTAAAGETITHQWIEVAPLDETGAPTAAPRAITPKSGHVLAYDLTLASDDGLIVAFRDDDTPSGSSGGRVSSVLVRLGGVSEPRVLASAEPAQDAPPEATLGLGAGVPSLLAGARGQGQGASPRGEGPVWLAIANVSGLTQLAPLTSSGALDGELRAEPAIGRGEPIAALADGLLVAHPAGKAMKLDVVRCAASTTQPH